MKLSYKSLSQTRKYPLASSEEFIDASAEAAFLSGGTATSVKVVAKESADLSEGKLVNADTSVMLKTATIPSDRWSTPLQTLIDQPPSSLPYQLIAGGIAFCIAVVTWANLGHIEEVGKARGRLVPLGEAYKVHPVISGKVARVYVQEGQIVKAGEVLAQLDQEIALNELERLRQELTAYQTQVIQTQALIDKTRLETKTRMVINQAEIQGHQATIAQALSKIQSQKIAIAQGEERAKISQVLLNQLSVDATAQQERLQRLKSLVEQGALSQEQLFQAQQSLSDRQRTITQQTGDIQQTLAESKREQMTLQQVLAESQRLQAELTQKQAEGNTVQLQAEQTIQKLQVQKTQLQAQVQQTEKLIQEAKTKLKQLTLTAPVDGVVLSLNVRNSGEVVQSGQTIAELAPENAPLILEATLPTKEAGFIKLGNQVKIKFDAYPYQDYSIIPGNVISISPNSIINEQLGAVYRVEVAMERNYVKANYQTIKFQAGQTATAEIIIRRRRIADILLEPLRELQAGGNSL
ncbi:HlyD family efflux transporter periplasmic adaptor subunit [Fortiea sp. LEGE XX443]|uniref:HlyD family efflux transporter periplasmic adaptor subunit n=1 Tax=Fortiea sp. LEGE XX443 TaxID=1828611 RepID=UPI00187EBBC5|nr:HlyD family efflux transporter periplasmic adaptor subunit [Fortiea sp. LEGE XX443]MBE9005390.1 HlyD family efflux transporter periplasmic adaptor subunit [Fortiea sp. LEGE XX443]